MEISKEEEAFGEALFFAVGVKELEILLSQEGLVVMNHLAALWDFVEE